MKREYRFTRELRATSSNGNPTLEGYAIQWNTKSTDANLPFTEIVAPGATARCLRSGADVKCLWQHDPSQVLGRIKNGTLQLNEDSRGLHFRCELDKNNPTHVAAHASIRRGDVSEMSFGFTCAPDGQEWSDESDARGNRYTLRRLTDINLEDVSPVTYPAYAEGTSVSARSRYFPDGIPSEIEVRSRALVALKREHRGMQMDDGNCSDARCWCQNRMTDPLDVWNDDDPLATVDSDYDADDDDIDNDDDGDDDNFEDQDDDKKDKGITTLEKITDDARSHRSHRGRRARRSTGKVRTKLVGGQNLPARCFACVGDRNDTATWKYPVHTKAAVESSLAACQTDRNLNPVDYARVTKAAEHFGVHVSRASILQSAEERRRQAAIRQRNMICLS